jgi:hypothetical protein
MEFGVATFSAVAAVVISKLCVVMENILKKVPEIRADVRCIKEDLEAIEAAIELHGPNREHVSFFSFENSSFYSLLFFLSPFLYIKPRGM